MNSDVWNNVLGQITKLWNPIWVFRNYYFLVQNLTMVPRCVVNGTRFSDNSVEGTLTVIWTNYFLVCLFYHTIYAGHTWLWILFQMVHALLFVINVLLCIICLALLVLIHVWFCFLVPSSLWCLYLIPSTELWDPWRLVFGLIPSRRFNQLPDHSYS